MGTVNCGTGIMKTEEAMKGENRHVTCVPAVGGMLCGDGDTRDSVETEYEGRETHKVDRNGTA